LAAWYRFKSETKLARFSVDGNSGGALGADTTKALSKTLQNFY
jgi:hypothetical protein